MTSICLLILALSLSGCGTLWDLFLRDRQGEDDEAACRSQCSGFKEHDDYRHCLQKCTFDKSLARSEWKDKNKQRETKDKEQKEVTKKEQSEFDKNLDDKLLKGRQKLGE